MFFTICFDVTADLKKPIGRRASRCSAGVHSGLIVLHDANAYVHGLFREAELPVVNADR